LQLRLGLQGHSAEARYDLRFLEGTAGRQLDVTLGKSPLVRVAAPQVRPDSELVIELDGELAEGLVEVVLRAQAATEQTRRWRAIVTMRGPSQDAHR
jgi:hypothetical protein